jgi:predicted DNA-binding transcriptional regulator AlpA
MSRSEPQRLIRLPEVENLTGLKKSAIYQRIAEGRFPAPIRVTERASAFIESEVSDWINQRIAESRKAA